MLTITDISNRLGVSRSVGYGLIHFLEKKGLIKPTSKVVTQKKGKPAYLYAFTQEHADQLAQAVQALMQPATETAPVAETQTETSAAAV